MYTTAKEVHVYIDGAMQLLSSNRKQSIHPPLLDMFLNNAVVEYISSKFPNGYNGKDIESTLKRYTGISMLKSTVRSIPVINSNSLYNTVKVPKPYNAIKLQSVSCSYIRPYVEANKIAGIKSIGTIEINDKLKEANNFVITVEILSSTGVPKLVNIDLSSVLSNVKSESGMFYFYDYLLDILRNTHRFNVKYDSKINNGNRLITIEPAVGEVISILRSTSTYAVCTKTSLGVSIPNGTSSGISACSIYSDVDAKIAIGDFYRSRNSHLDPIVEIDEEGVIIYYTDFIPNFVDVDYIRYPKLFNIITGQIPEIDISKDFLDFATKQISLILGSPSYDRIVNETIKNS